VPFSQAIYQPSDLLWFFAGLPPIYCHKHGKSLPQAAVFAA